jgi:acetyl-CoA acyltransferase 2
MEKIYLLKGQRTAFGSFGGSLKDISATELAATASQGTLMASNVKPDQIDHTIMGNVIQSGADAAYLARHVGLKAGIPLDRGAYIVNRLCGSGFESVINAALMIKSGDGQAILAGGVEQMSQIPYVARKVRFDGLRLGNFELEDYMTSALTDAYAGMPMAITAENLGEKYGITRLECDQYSIETQRRYKKALDLKYFDAEICDVKVTTKKGELIINKDEHPKPEATLEKISAMKALFKKEGLVTAATASGVVDGAACTIVASESFVKNNNLKPMAEIISWASVGCDPKIMGIGPAPAIRKALTKANLTLEQMDLVEVNEAFAAQFLSVAKELKLDPAKTNVNGGAIAVGHPLGASGTRILNHLCYEMQRRGSQYSLGSACIGGGQGIAVILKRV